MCFNAWNWGLCLTGYTTVEFFRRQGLTDTDSMFDYSFDNMRDNLFVVFGTYKPFRILSPSLRALPFSGLEWSFVLKDLGYDEMGYRWENYFDQESNQQIEMAERTETSVLQQLKDCQQLVEEF